MITSDQLKDVLTRVDALHKYLEIDKKKIEFEEEQLRTQAPDFWDDPQRAQEQMKKVKGIQKWIDGYKDVRDKADELQLAFDFYHDDMVTEQEVDDDYAQAIKAIEDLECICGGQRPMDTKSPSATCRRAMRPASRASLWR